MYKYIEEEGADSPYFYFDTENKLTYYVAFRNMSQDSYPLHNVYSLDFGEVNSLKGKNDTKVSLTILHIIINFLKTDNTLVIHFLCDSGDNRQLHRKRLFTRWFSVCNEPNWIKYDYDFDAAPYNLSFIYCSNVYDTSIMETEILLTLDVYERAKDE